MKRLLLATHNLGKIQELSALLAPIECIALPHLNITSPEETGLTFIENALIKARHASQHSHLPALSDDSGLVIPALNGQPGIRSARFAHEHACDQENLDYLCSLLKQHSEPKLKAYFYCALVYLQHPEDPAPIIATGQLKGYLLSDPKGTQGFGYDPIFYYPPLQKTLAEIPLEKKNEISHRALALQSFINEFNSA